MMKTIGVLGGIGPQATIDFEARLHHVSQRLIPQKDNSGYPPLVVLYFRELPSITTAGGSLATTRSAVNPRMLDAAKRLGGWADFLAIPCNGAHIYFDEITQAAGRHAIDMIDAVVTEVQRRALSRVGILDFRAPGIGLYHERLSARGVSWEATPAYLLSPLFAAVLAVQEGRPGAEVGQPARTALDHLRSKQVDGIILGCTEIPFMLGAAADDPDILNPVQMLAEAAVRYALG
jgi:aspartate racemase